MLIFLGVYNAQNKILFYYCLTKDPIRSISSMIFNVVLSAGGQFGHYY